MNEQAEMAALIRAHSFAILCSHSVATGELAATHLPFVFAEQEHCLYSHMARANPQWAGLDGQSVLVVFQGPHAYISPAWYETAGEVPTWNYTAVHVRGIFRALTGESSAAQVQAMLATIVRTYDPKLPLPEHLDEPAYQAMQKAIVGFRIEITHMEGTAKLSQNKAATTRQNVVAALRSSSRDQERALAGLMEEVDRR